MIDDLFPSPEAMARILSHLRRLAIAYKKYDDEHESFFYTVEEDGVIVKHMVTFPLPFDPMTEIGLQVASQALRDALIEGGAGSPLGWGSEAENALKGLARPYYRANFDHAQTPGAYADTLYNSARYWDLPRWIAAIEAALAEHRQSTPAPPSPRSDTDLTPPPPVVIMPTQIESASETPAKPPTMQQRNALTQYERACRALNGVLTDRQAYDELVKQEAIDPNRIKFLSWTANLRKARQFDGKQKTASRSGRGPTRSMVRLDGADRTKPST